MENKTIKLLLYCTKAKPYLYGCYSESDGDIGTIGGFGYDTSYCPTEDVDSKDRTVNLNGYIVAEAECDLVELIEFKHYCDDYLGEDGKYYQTYNLDQDNLLKMSCLNEDEIDDYLKSNDGYAIYLKNVKPFDELRAINDTYCYNKLNTRLKNAPQNMCMVYSWNGEPYVLISIKPEWLCKILNGEKTIEVRKSILNVLKELIK